MSNEKKKSRALQCARCGGILVKSRSIKRDDAEEVVREPIAKCSACGLEYDRKTGEYYGVFADELAGDADNSLLRTGARGMVHDAEYEIIGRIRYQEGDERVEGAWDEWIAVSAGGALRYFVEEEGVVYAYGEYIPQSIDLESDPDRIVFNGKKISRSDAFVGRIVFAEGKLPWKPAIGEPVTMYDFRKDGAKYTIEQSGVEVTVTKGEKLFSNDVIRAFGGEKEQALLQGMLSRRSTFRRKAVLYIICGILAFLAAAASILDTTPVDGMMRAGNGLSLNVPVTTNKQKMFRSEALYGPFNISRGDSLYNAGVSVNKTAQEFRHEWLSYRFMLIPRDRLLKVLNGRDDPESIRKLFDEIDALWDPLECYSFSGYFRDSEGRGIMEQWYLRVTGADDDFLLEKPGAYYAYLELESREPLAVDSIVVRMERVRSYRYYIVIMVVLFGLAFVNSIRARRYNMMPINMA